MIKRIDLSVYGRRIHALLATVVLAALVSGTASAQVHEHEGDILPTVVGGQLATEGDRPIDALTGAKIYEGDFGDLGGGPRATDDPGYDHQDGLLLPGSLLGIRGMGVLEYWDGNTWSTAAAGTTVSIEDALGSLISFSSAGVDNPNGYLGQVSPTGTLHEHVDMSISAGAATGAYGFFVRLFGETSLTDPTAPYADSAPFMLVMNYGLSEALFEAGVDARVAPVPLPAAVWLLLSGLMGMGAIARRQRPEVAAT